MIATLITIVVAFVVSGIVVNHSQFPALWQWLNRKLSPTFCVTVAALLYCVALGGMAILRHLSMNSNALDLGLMDQIVWNSAQGRWFEETFIAGHSTSFLGHHFSPSLALVVPFYWLLPRPETLLLLQVGCISGSAILLYHTGVKLTGRVWIAAALALMVLLHPLVHDAALFDFHQDAIGMFFLALGLFGITYKRWGVASVGWLISILAKEEIAIYWMAIAGFLLLVNTEKRPLKTLFMGAFMVANALWLFVVITLLIPSFQSEEVAGFSFFERYAFWGRSVGEVFGTITGKPLDALQMLLLPDRIGGLGMMLLPVLLFLLRSRWMVLILLIPLGINSLSDLVGQHNYRFHYSLLPIIVIVYATIWAVVFAEGKNIQRRATLFLLVASIMLYAGVSQMGVRVPELVQNYLPDDHDQLGYQVMAMIPAEASVIAQNKLVAHLSQRRFVTLLSRLLAEPADYYMLDLQSPPAPQTREVYLAEITALLANPAYGVVYLEDGYILLESGASHDAADVEAAMKMVEKFVQ